MKQIIVILCLFAAACSYSVKLQINGEAEIDPYIFEDLINSTIEGLRPDIPDPLFLDTLDFSLPDDEDSLFTGNGSISNLNVTGLQGFQFTALNFQLIGLTLNFTLVFPVLDIYTDYDLDLTVANIPIFGSGNATVHLNNVTILATGQANLTAGISIENLLVQANLGDGTFEIHGLFNDEDVSALVSSILNDLAVKLIDDNHELITEIISPIIQTIVNEVLAALLQGTTTLSNDVTVESIYYT